MKTKTKRILAVMLSLVMAVSLMAGVGSKTGNAASSSDVILSIQNADGTKVYAELKQTDIDFYTTTVTNWVIRGYTYDYLIGVTAADLITHFAPSPTDVTNYQFASMPDGGSPFAGTVAPVSANGIFATSYQENNKAPVTGEKRGGVVSASGGANWVGGTNVFRVTYASGTEPAAPADSVVVINGIGTGIYSDSSTVTITANNAPNGQRFKQWSITPTVTYTDGTTAVNTTAKFIKPNTTVTATATYEAIPATNYYWSDIAGDAVIDTDYSVSSGNYTVKTALGLAYIARIVNAGESLSGKSVTLANDINVSEYYWMPIGFLVLDGGTQHPFAGTFDGGGHYIDGMKIDNTNTDWTGVNTSSGTAYYHSEGNALFGVNDGTIKNLGVKNADSNAARAAGGIVGYNYGTVTQCMSSGTVTANGTTNATRSAGGIVGFNLGTVSYCYSSASVTNNSGSAGGIVGGNGNNDPGTIDHCFFIGTVTGNASNIGGIAGTSTVTSTVTNSYWLADSAVRPFAWYGISASNPEPTQYPDTLAMFNTSGILTNDANGNATDGATLLSKLGSNFKAGSSALPILAWESSSTSTTPATPAPTPEPSTVALEVYIQQGNNGTPKLIKSYTAAQLSSLATANNAGFAYLFYQGSEWKAVVATKVVALDNIIADSGTSSYWSSTSYLMFQTSDNAYSFNDPQSKAFVGYDVIQSAQYFSNGTQTNSVPAGFAIAHTSGSLGSDIDAGVAYLANASRQTSTDPRFVCGITTTEFTENSARGSRMPGGVTKFCIVYEASDVPKGSAQTDSGDDTGETTTPPVVELPFNDVKSTDWYYNAVSYVYEKGLFAGEAADKFAPNTPMPRKQIITVIARLAGVDTTGGDNYYDKAVAWAVENKISDGLNLDDTVTREQIVTMLWRYAGRPSGGSLGSFPDGDKVSSWAVDAMSWAIGAKIIVGKDGKIAPGDTATRAEVAQILMRYCKLFVDEK